MSGINFKITDSGTKSLGNLIGKTIQGLETAIVARDDMALGTVRMYVEDASIDITTTLKDLPINNEGDTEEFGVLTVSEAAPGELCIEGVDKEISWCNISASISGITLVNSHVTATEGGTSMMERVYTQAIVFELAEGNYLVLDKGPWFSEMITIGMGAIWKDLVYDDSQDWEDDPEEPEIHYRWQQSVERL